MKDICPHDIHTLEEMFDKASSPVIVTHMKPDGDAIGSSIALYHFLSSEGKDVKIVINDRFPAYLDFLAEGPVAKDIIINDEKPKRAKELILASDLIICLDFNVFHRTDSLESYLLESNADKVLIDHHLNPDRESFKLVFSETEVSSASELLYHILLATSRVDADASRLPIGSATALMTGMTTDTNNFANSVFPTTLAMASDLLGVGVDRDSILNYLYNQHSENRLRLLGHIMKDLLKTTPDGVAYVVLDTRTQRAYNIKEGDTEGFVNMPLSIAGIRMSLFLKEDGDKIRVSIRSKKGTSANQCAKMFFNGGGHENAAGGRLYINKEVESIEGAGEYIEKYTHLYFTQENEATY